VDVISTPSGFTDTLLRLTLATLCGAAIGANREFRQKPAGLRTHALVALGVALLTTVGLHMGGPGGELNALSRVVQGVIVGIGFVGGGTIFHRGGQVEGLSTAGAIWVAAAAGTAAACGLWRAALISTALALFILIAGEPVNRAIRDHADDSD
jgi:putative Mg2+ transporter-C (MgtC) family protein